MPRSFARLIVLLALTAVATVPNFAQKTSHTEVPASALPPADAPAPIQTIKANARLVVLDVVVTDSKQAAVHNLKGSDFTLLENGSAQQITGFEEHAAPPVAVRIPPMHPLPPGIFTNFTPTPPGSAINVLLLDALNTPMKDQSYVREQLLEFLRKTPPDTRVAIFGLNDRLIMLQGFTTDLSLLRSVVEKTAPSPSMMLADSVGNGGTAPISQMMIDASGGAADVAQLLTSVQQFEGTQASTDSQIRAQATLLAMNQLAHYLAGLPGRKNLIWFSGSFPLDVFPQSGIEHPFWTVDNSEDEFRQTTDLLTRSQVAVYPVDARGLQTHAGAVATKPTLASMANGGLLAANDKAFQDEASEHMTMNRMAADTGGQAYVDNNGLSAAVAKAMDNGSNYYTISYTPTNAKQDGAFRKIQVKLARPGVNLAYRSGYFADDSAKQGPNTAVASANQPSPFIKAMLRGAPDATEILLKLQVLPASSTEEQAVVKGNILSPEPAAKSMVQGPFHRYTVDVAADARDIRVTPTPDGRFQFAVELRTFVYDGTGHVINTAVQNARGNLTASSYANMLHVGLPFHQEISVPVAGEYYLRTSVHDLGTDRFGSVEIPVATVAKLAPLAASGSAPAAK